MSLMSGCTAEMGAPPATTRWTPPGKAFAGGRWRETERHTAVTDPETGAFLGEVADSTAAEVRAAVDALVDTFRVSTAADRADWPLWRRREALHRAAELLRQQAERFTAIVSSEGCKTIRDARREVARAAETLQLSAGAGHALQGSSVPFEDTSRGADRLGWSSREPLGVVAAITPFNDPLNLVAHKVGPALLSGNVIAVKPHEATPLSALALAELLLEAGVPGDRIAVLPGGPTAGRELVSHPGVDVVSFTGGVRTADEVARLAGARTLLMELGGSNPVIVDHGVDLMATAQAIAEGAFGCAGQNCLSVQRVYVVAQHYDELLGHLTHMTAHLSVGSKHDESTDVGPLIDAAAARRVEHRVEEAVARGAVVRAGAVRQEATYQPTILTDLAPDDPIVTDEIFGPVVSVLRVADLDDAVNQANRAATSLQAGVFTRDTTAALRTARRLRAGAVMINDTSDFRIDAMPFGGFHRSGIGREGVTSAVVAMTAPKVIAARLTSIS
ncbi:aldehyde dehydrogenase family protein [Nonomuraea sp. NPDC050153]|uniref:aldehyde dehydrogenase family protein n=1 Tax=Nonomuraea sp. NPDC050153 TaxID=3364359 RepID=UPI0037BB925D